MLNPKESTFGSTYKWIRKARNLSQLNVTKENISRSSLSKFEHNKQTIYLNNFLSLLSELKLSVSEFLFINNDYQFHPADQLKARFYKIHFTGNVNSYEDLSQNIEEFLDREDDWYLEMMKRYIDILIRIERDTTGEQTCRIEALALEIWTEIDQFDEWFINDIRMLNVIIYYLPRKQADETIERIPECLKNYEEVDALNVFKPSFQLNASLVYIKYGMLEKASRLADSALDSVKFNHRYDIYVVGLIRKGAALKDFELIHKGLRLVRELGDAELSQLMNIEVIKNIPMHFTKYPEDMDKMSWDTNESYEKDETDEPTYRFNGYYWFSL